MAANVLRYAGFWRSVLVLCSGAVVVAGAYLAETVSQSMMSPVALVGSWLMFAFLAAYLVVRFRPAVGLPVLVGVGVGTTFVAIVGGMAMVMG